MKRNQKTLIVLLAGLCISLNAIAHGNADNNGFMSGILHPAIGLDHLLAMLSVGMLSAKIGGRAIWYVPATFIIVMFFGNALGIYYPDIVNIELGISLSIVVLGTALLFKKSPSVFLAVPVVAFFALLHGHAHGTEMPDAAEPFLYALGFMTGTTIIHILGIIIVELLNKTSKAKLIIQVIGGLIVSAGLYFVAIGI